MNSTAGFVVELLQCARDVDLMDRPELARLLERAAYTIRDQLEARGLEPANTGSMVDDLLGVAKNIGIFTKPEIAENLLRAAGMIDAGIITDSRWTVN